jgi:hypothetical protein
VTRYWCDIATEGIARPTIAFCPIAGGVDDDFRHHRPARRLDAPLAPTRSADAGHLAGSGDPRSEIARALGKGLRQLRRIDVAVERVPLPAFEVVQLDEGIARLDVGGTEHLEVDPLVPRHLGHVPELVHALAVLGKSKRCHG